jgi:hypothetical protein
MTEDVRLNRRQPAKACVGNGKDERNTMRAIQTTMKPRRLKPATTIMTQPLARVIQGDYNINTKDTKLIGLTPGETCCQG